VPRDRSRHRPSAQKTEPEHRTSPTSTTSALDAKIRLLSQRVQVIENNEKVIGRTLAGFNKKLKEIDGLLAASGGAGKAPDLTELKEVLKQELKSEIKAIAPPLTEGGAAAPKVVARASQELSDIKRNVDALSAQVKEIKYIVDSINPMEYVTIEQIRDIIERKIKSQKTEQGP